MSEQINKKILNPEEMAAVCDKLRTDGKSIVQCHGVFDIFHIGHKRHLDAAKTEADTLVVSLTSDRFVNKGPDRPIFNQLLRAEMLTALDIVDYVMINDDPSAIPAIEAIKPDVYFKGDEYKAEDKDISGKIAHERETVEKHGGKLKFSSEITFSSSNIAKHTFSNFPKHLLEYLSDIKSKFRPEQINEAMANFARRRVLIIGEVIVDEYTYVSGLGKPSKENIVSTLFDHKDEFMGGVVPIANTVAEFSNSVDLLTIVGQDDLKTEKTRSSLKPDIGYHAFSLPNSVTTRKQRMVDKDHFRKLFEINYVTDAEDNTTSEKIETWLKSNIKNYDVVLVCDFGHGLIRQETADIISSSSKFLCINVQTNSYNRGFNLISKYKSADFACIDGPEARLATVDKKGPIENIARQLRSMLSAEGLVVTNGKLGAIGINRNDAPISVPALSDKPVDTMGAGDAFFTLASCCFFETRSIDMACFMGNSHASIQVESVGQAKIGSGISILNYIKTLLA